MILVALVTIAMVLFLVVTAWSALREPVPDDGTAAEESGPDPAEPKPETLEGVLVRQLMADEISGPQYRRAMQRLAERDADRHPLTLPPPG
ncbi:hypothetical protein Ani05nite_76700 [Amorphoplanes nipponensis]|uniref:Uncharacterized protein n=1 Tax=Actinoplanes nipponensis TaxID=135950 RepID=A0A919JRW7_9ACTN|nr:hypothetical protein [Actinoplanes nipponensis]GIE54136.1 hypothetical protein Ani05nite_76700 [Actinoplanes nipponensis]